MPVYTPCSNVVTLHLGRLHVENDHCNYWSVKCLAKLQHMMEIQMNSYGMHAQKKAMEIMRLRTRLKLYVPFTVTKHILHKYHSCFVLLAFYRHESGRKKQLYNGVQPECL